MNDINFIAKIRFIRTINAYFGLYTEHQINQCIENTANQTNTLGVDIIKQLQDNLPTVHLYIEKLDSDIQMYFKLSQKLINFFATHNWKIIGFLGEGAEADVFRVVNLKNDKNGALLLQSVGIDDVSSGFDIKYNDLWNIQKEKLPFGNTYVDIYDIINYSNPYSENITYIENSNPDFNSRPVLILEVAPYTLDTYIENVVRNRDMKSFKVKFNLKYRELLLVIFQSGYIYTDIKADNIAIFPTNKDFYIKFIDIGTFRKVSQHEANNWLNKFLDFDVFLTID